MFSLRFLIDLQLGKPSTQSLPRCRFKTITVRQPKIVLSVLSSNTYSLEQQDELHALVGQLRRGARVELLKKNEHNEEWNKYIRDGEPLHNANVCVVFD